MELVVNVAWHWVGRREGETGRKKGVGEGKRGEEREKGRVALAEGKIQNDPSLPSGLQSTISVRP